MDENDDAGILNGIEDLGLNLQDTELVSLSARDKGKEVIDYSEGVCGLVRAIRNVCARSALMELRPLEDRPPRDFNEKNYDIRLSSKDNPIQEGTPYRLRRE